MKGGIISVLQGPTELIEDFHGRHTQDGIEYQYSVESTGTFDDPRIEQSVQAGRAAMEVPEEEEKIELKDGSISKRTTVSTATRYTNWFLIPGEFLIIENEGGRFLYDLLASELGWEANRAELNLTMMGSDYLETDLWQVGFYDHAGAAHKGVIYGEHVVEDQDIGDALDNSRVNQLGLEYTYDQDTVKATLTESGYVEIYQPSSYNTPDFAAYIQDEVATYVDGVYTE